MDLFWKGFLSGSGSGIMLNLWGFFIKNLLPVANRNYVDWTAVIISGVLPTTWYEFLYALITNLIWCGFLGILFAYLLPKLTSDRFLLKGAIYGFMIGFLIHGSAILLRMPFFTMIPFRTSSSLAFGGLLWGVLTAALLRWLERKDQSRM
ncbi:MAG TPA: hypothetical protein GXZ98_09730 [Firmicutes bacterium]|jgi:uncharacterized membrane protein YagU involved in acid resistance|nr:hypothetical protein [Bacillota bacterium]